ncbi:MAG: hydantoinase/oxoprolinase family protein, partial [Thermoproteota archaeon]|nr:hydantoinase/oxoprolinase family protein [Thermoproteota archaeon]
MGNEATLCIDVGGTFTDYVMLFNDEIITFKLPTETKNLENVISNFLNSLKIDLNIKELIYVSTIASNLLLGQLGIAMPKVCLITTKGFRDVIEIGRQNRPELYNLFFEKKKPLVERRYRFEVNERIDSKGKIIKEVDEKEIENIAKIIIQNKIESVAICYINSYVNPFNEFKTKELLKKLIPYNVYIVTSYEVCPEIGEYERFSTTVLNAILMPVMSSHMDKLLEEAKKRKIKKFYVMGSIGGLLSYDKVSMKPVYTIESGPIAGILGSLYLSKIYNLDNVVSFDMGGTTAKSSLIQNFSPFITTEYEFDSRRIGGRSLKGTGYPIKIPFIDIVEVSAGGGTIVWIDETNSLKVGPLSAGADPGPACYGKSMIPTITDANLILGRLSEKLLGGNMIVYKERSVKAFENLSKNLGLSVEETAYSAIK